MRNAVPSLSASLLRTAVLLCFLVFLVPAASATSYYFSSSASCPGSGTSGAPYCALTSANSIDFNPGDQMLLARGSLWTGQQITLSDSDDGSSVSWVTMDAYGSGARPILDWTKLSGQKLLVATNIDYWNIRNLEVREAHVGMQFDYTTLGHQGLHLENIYFHDMFYDASDGSIYDGSAMYVSANGSPPSGTNFYIKDVLFLDLEAKSTAYAPGLAYGDPGCPSDECDTGDPIQNVVLKNNYFHDIEGATSIQDIATLTMIDNQFANFATVHQNQGTTNLFFWHTSNTTVANSVFDRVPDTSSHDQSHIDFEGFTNDVRIRHNYFTDAAGNAMEVMAWRGAGSYLTNITIDGNVFNRNSWDPNPSQSYFNGAVAIIPSCVFAPGPGTVSNSLYYEPDGLFNANSCSHSFTLSSNTDAGSSASFAVSGKDFSSVQGTGNWRYRYSNDGGANWADLGYFDASWDNQLNDRWQPNSGTTYPWVTRFRMHPDGVGSHYVAREWTAPSAGTVNIRSRVLKAISGGNGINARITKNGTALWGWTLIGGSDEVGVAANLSSVSVAASDKIRFEIDGNGDGSYDWASWQPMITFVSGGGGGCTGNLAPCATTSASSTDTGNGYCHCRINDGITADWNGWSSLDPLPEWVQLTWGTSQTVDRVEFYTTDGGGYFTRDFQIQYWNGSSWVTPSGWSVTGNNLKHRTFTVTPAVSTTAIRVYATLGDVYNIARVDELEAYNGGGGGGCGGVCWEFSTNGNLEGWSPDYQATATVSSGSLHVTATGTDAQIYNLCFVCGGLGMSPSNRYIHLRLQNDTTSTTSKIFFITDADQTWNGAKSKAFTISANSAYTLYVVDMGTVAGWTGTIRKLRVDVGDPSVNGGVYHYDYIKALPTP